MHDHQRGNTLLISLILLLLFTVIGLSSVSNVNFNQKMSSNYRDSDLSFQAAEAALAEGEAYAEALSASLSEQNFESTCSGSACFTPQCVDGRCFNGSYAAGTACTINEPSPRIAANETTWSAGGRARASQITFPELASAPKYIIEFLCFVQTDPLVTALAPPPPYPVADWAYLFRVTSYAEGINGSARVMLQSTYKVLR